MASSARSFTIDWASVEIADVQSKSFEVTNSLVDVTTDDDDGIATYLSTIGKQEMTVSISGVAASETVLADAYVIADSSQTAIIHLPSTLTTPGNITGTFIVESFSYDAPASDGTVTFSLSLRRSGSATYTASV